MTIFKLPQKKFIFFKLLVCSIFCFVFLFAIGLKIPEFFTVKKASATIAESSKYLPLDPANKNININGYNIEMSGGWLTYDGDNEGIYIGTNGNVGIGTTSPAYKFQTMGYGYFSQPVTVGTPTADTHVTTKSYVDSELQSATTTVEDTYVNESGDTMTGALDIQQPDTGDIFNISSSTAGDLMTITNAGNVGIGTTGPSRKLDVNGDIRIRGNDIFESGNNNFLTMNYDDTSRMRTHRLDIGRHLDAYKDWGGEGDTLFLGWSTANSVLGYNGASSGDVANVGVLVTQDTAFKGNVGIGTTNPSYALDVAGYGQFSQPVTVGTPIADTHATTKSYVDSELSEATSTAENTYVNESGDTMTGALNMNSNIDLNSNTLFINKGDGLEMGRDDSICSSNDCYYLAKTDANAADPDGEFSIGERGNDDIFNAWMHFDSGNVGIGTTNPSTALEVNGIYETGLGNSYDKIRVYPSSSYTIGMKSAQTLGFLNDWATTFTMNADNNRGWLWRDTSDAASDGAMSLTTNGRLYVKSTAAFSGNVGIGTTGPAYALDVAGYGQFAQPVTVGTPTANTHAATKSYVDSEIGSVSDTYVNESGDTMTGNLAFTPTGPSAQIGDTFADNTYKSYINFNAGSGSNDPGYIMHETSGTSTNEGVLHIIPSDDNQYGDYVSIHGTNDSDMIKLHTSGDIEGINTIRFQDSDRRIYGISSDGNDTVVIDGNWNELLEMGRVIGWTGSNFYIGSNWDTVDHTDDMIEIGRDVGHLEFEDTTGEVMRVTGGNVGIGATAPAEKLEVAGNIRLDDGGDAYIENQSGYVGIRPHDATHGLIMRDFDGNSTNWSGIRTQDDGSMELRADGGSYSQLVLADNGNVGLGTASPGAKLDVAGGGSFGNPVTVGTPTAASHAATKDYVDSNFGGGSYKANTVDQDYSGGCNCDKDNCASGYDNVDNIDCTITNYCVSDQYECRGYETCSCTCNVCEE